MYLFNLCDCTFQGLIQKCSYVCLSFFCAYITLASKLLLYLKEVQVIVDNFPFYHSWKQKLGGNLAQSLQNRLVGLQDKKGNPA